MVSIYAQPIKSLVDEEVSIIVTGLKKEQKTTLYCNVRTDGGDLYEACAHYIASAKGEVDVTKDRSFGGKYVGVEPMGLFWALVLSKRNSRQVTRFLKKNVETPHRFNVEVFENWIPLEVITTKSNISSVVIEKWYKSYDVERLEISGKEIKGTLFIPPGPGPFKSVVDLFGGAGGLMEFRAAMLASRGFLTLALAYFDYEDLPLFQTLHYEYFEEAVQFLHSHPKSVKGGVGVVGVSYGSEIALGMGTYVPLVTCNVCINGSHHVQSLPHTFRGYTNENLPLMNLDKIQPSEVNERAVIQRDVWNLPKSDLAQYKALIEFHKANSSTLFLFSGDDGTYDTKFIQRRAKRLLKRYGGGEGKNEFMYFPGAGHLLEIPYTPLSRVVYVPMMSMYLDYGGQPVPHARAQEQAWKETLKFLDENIIPHKSKL